MGEVAQIPLGLHLFLIEAVRVKGQFQRKCVYVSIPNKCVYAYFFIILTTYCCTQKSTGENVTKDNNSIVHNDESFHTIEERYILGEEGNKSPDCNVKILHVT